MIHGGAVRLEIHKEVGAAREESNRGSELRHQRCGVLERFGFVQFKVR